MSSRSPFAFCMTSLVFSMFAVAGCTGEDTDLAAPVRATPAATASFPSPGRISQERSTDCLKETRADVGPVPRTDDRARAVADLAQRNSVAVGMGADNVLVIFAANDSEAAFLADALRVSDDPYRIVIVDNAVLLYPREVEERVSAVRRCLR